MMRGITRTLGALFAASALAAPVWADVVTGEPDAVLIASFDGNNNVSVTDGQTAWISGWGGETPGASNYITTRFGQGFQVASGVHPWVDLGAKSEFTCALYADISSAPAGAVLAAFGTANNHIALVKSAADTVQVWQGGAAVSGLSVTSSALSVGYHLLVFGNDTAGALLSVDGATPVTTSTALTTPAGGFQLGAVYAGMGSHDWSRAYGMKVDELRGYDTKLTTAQIETLADRFPPPTLYTADLSSATTATYSTLSWSPSGTPAAYDAVEFIAASTGTTLTMDGATPILSSLAVSGGTLIVERGAVLDAETAAISAGSTSIKADADLSGLKTSLGTVTVAANKTLTTGEGTTLTNLTFGSATAKVKVTGSTGLSAIPYGMQSKTGTVEIVPPVTVTVTDEKWSFNTAQTFTYSANVEAPRLVVGDSGSANATITQLGGTISLSSTETSCNSTTASAILLGHWNTTTTYNLQAGTLSAPGGALCLGWDGTTTLNVGVATGNAALVDVYALKSGDRYREAAVTVNPTGTLQVGAGGIALGSHSAKSVTLAGGTLLATANATANILHANGLNVTAPSTVAAAPSTTLTINKVSGASNLTLGTAAQTGSVVISDVSAYTGTATATTGTLDLHNATFGETLPTFAVASGAALILPAGTEGAITVPDGAALTLVLSSAQRVSGYTTTASGSVTFKKVASGDTLADLTSEDGTVEDGTFTPTLNTWTATTAEEDGSYTWGNVANWSKGAAPEEGDSVKISVTAEGTTLTLGSAVTVANVSIAGEGTLALAGEALTVSGMAVVSANTTAAKDKLLAGTIQIDDGKTLTVSTSTTFANVDTLGAGNALALPALTGTGTLVKEGTGDLGLFGRSAEPTIQVKAGTLHVRSTPTTAMKLAVEDGATVNFTAWYTSFNNSLNSFALKGGSSFILSNGLNDSTPQTIAGAMTIAEATDEKPVKIYGSAFGPVTLNMPISGTGTVEFAEGGSFVGNGTYACDKPVTVSGVISGDIKVKVSDQANAVIFSGANTYTGGTDIASGSILQASGIVNLGTGGVSVNENATLKLTSTADVSEANADYSAITGTGTIHFSGTGYRTLPNGESAMFDSALALCNEQSAALVITRASAVTTVGSLSGTGAFRVDWGNGERTLKILQAKNTTYSGDMIYDSYTERLAKVVVAGAADAAEKTLTLSGSTTIAKLLEIEATGSVNLTGSWAGAVTVAGKLAGTGTVSGTLTFNSGATLDASAGALTAQTVTIADDVTVAVMLPASAAAGTTVLTCASPADVAAKLTGAPEGLKFAANEAGTAVVLATAIVIPPVAEVELSEASQAVLLAKAEAAGLPSVTAVTGSTTVDGAPKTLTAAQIDAALAVFGDSVVTADRTNNTLKVDYNFGIVAVEPYYYNGTLMAFIVKVKAETATGDAATLTSGVTINLVDGESSDKVINDLYGMGFDGPDSNGIYAAYFTSDATVEDRLVGRSFKVKASK